MSVSCKLFAGRRLLDSLIDLGCAFQTALTCIGFADQHQQRTIVSGSQGQMFTVEMNPSRKHAYTDSGAAVP
jgi:hypothetical protein